MSTFDTYDYPVPMPCRCYWKPRIYETEGALQLLKVSTDLSVDGSGSIIGTISQKPVVFDHLFWDNFVQAHTTSYILLECHHAKAALAFSQAMAGDGHTPTSGKPLGRIAFEIQHVQTLNTPTQSVSRGGHFRQLLFFFERGGNCRFFCGRRFLRRSQIWLGIHMKLWWILFTLQTYLPWKP